MFKGSSARETNSRFCTPELEIALVSLGHAKGGREPVPSDCSPNPRRSYMTTRYWDIQLSRQGWPASRGSHPGSLFMRATTTGSPCARRQAK